MKIECTVNGKPVSVDTDPRRRLLDLLREDLGLTGVKEGCGEGECGACSVLVNGRLANSCIIAAGQAAGADILTIEGFRDTPRYRVLEVAFAEAGAVQCGFCIPGMVMAAEALLRKIPRPTREEIRLALAGNLCRCTGYNMIFEAVEIAAEKGAGLWQP
jgi:carbon-monoxide dehydrogenase small subunit